MKICHCCSVVKPATCERVPSIHSSWQWGICSPRTQQSWLRSWCSSQARGWNKLSDTGDFLLPPVG